MTTAQILVISLAGIAVLAVAGAFAIAYRRSSERSEAWRDNVPREAARADQSALKVPVAVATGTLAVEAPAAAEPTGTDESLESELEELLDEAAPPVTVREVMIEEVSPEELGVTRRQFFTRALLGTFGAYMGLFGLSSLAFLWPRLSGGFGSDINAGPVIDIQTQVAQPDGSVLPLFLPEARAYIVPFDESLLPGTQFEGKSVVVNGLTALFQRCVHLGCRVPWCNTSQGFECPCHGSKYNFVGEYQAGPAPRNLDRFVIEDRNGDLIIKTGSIIQTARAPRSTVPYPQGPSCISLEASAEA